MNEYIFIIIFKKYINLFFKAKSIVLQILKIINYVISCDLFLFIYFLIII